MSNTKETRDEDFHASFNLGWDLIRQIEGCKEVDWPAVVRAAILAKLRQIKGEGAEIDEMKKDIHALKIAVKRLLKKI